MPRYSLYGFTLETDHPLRGHLDPTEAEPDLVFTCGAEPVRAVEPEEPVYDSGITGADGEPVFRCFRSAGSYRVHYTGTADFQIRRDAIHCRLLDPKYAYWVEIALLGPVLSFWLELTGAVALHASAVVEAGVALGFMANARSGKTSLAVSFVRAGGALLSDDLLPLRVSNGAGVAAWPGYPQIRMWPDLAESFAGSPHLFELAHPDFEKRRIPARIVGDVRTEPAPLAALFLPEREAGAALEVKRLGGAEAVAAVLRSSFAASILEAIPEMQVRRLGVAAAVVDSVPVCRLRYPDGLDRLPEVREAVLRWLGER